MLAALLPARTLPPLVRAVMLPLRALSLSVLTVMLLAHIPLPLLRDATRILTLHALCLLVRAAMLLARTVSFGASTILP